jgi:MFS family permease
VPFIGRWPATFRALRHRNFRIFWSGQLVSLTGTWMQNAAQGWLVLLLATREFGAENAALYVGLVTALSTTPIFLLSLFAGVLSDRWDRRRTLLGTQVSLMLLAFGLALLVALDIAKLWHVAVFGMLSGIVFALDMPTRQAFVKDIATPKDLLNAIALNSSAFNLARIIGPAVAAWLISVQWIGIAGALYANAASFLAVIAGLSRIRTPRQPALPRNGFLAEIKEGLAYVGHHRTIRLLMLMMAVYSVFGFSYAVLISVVAVQVLGRGVDGYGLLLTFGGIGAFAGAVLLASLAGHVRQGRVLLWGGLIFTLALVGFALSRVFLLSLVLILLVGGGLVVCSAGINGLIQAMTPDHLRGRVVSVWAFIFAGLTPVGALYAGVAAHLTSPSMTLLFSGLVCLLTIGLLSWRARWLWQLE